LWVARSQVATLAFPCAPVLKTTRLICTPRTLTESLKGLFSFSSKPSLESPSRLERRPLTLFRVLQQTPSRRESFARRLLTLFHVLQQTSSGREGRPRPSGRAPSRSSRRSAKGVTWRSGSSGRRGASRRCRRSCCESMSPMLVVAPCHCTIDCTTDCNNDCTFISLYKTKNSNHKWKGF
jgi:hypothetical protein